MPFNFRTLLLGVIWLFLATMGVAGLPHEARHDGNNHSVRSDSGQLIRDASSYAMTAWDDNIRIYYIVEGTQLIQELCFSGDGSKSPAHPGAWTRGVTLQAPLEIDGSIFVLNTLNAPTGDTGIELYLGGADEYLYRFRSGDGQTWGSPETIQIPRRWPLSAIRAVPWMSADQGGSLHRSIFFNDNTGNMQEISQGPSINDAWSTPVRVTTAAAEFAVSATPWSDYAGGIHQGSERIVWNLLGLPKILKGQNWQNEVQRFSELPDAGGGRFGMLEAPASQQVIFYFNTGKGSITERRMSTYWAEYDWMAPRVETHSSGESTLGQKVRDDAPILAVYFVTGGRGRACLLHWLEDGSLGVTAGEPRTGPWEATVPIFVA